MSSYTYVLKLDPKLKMDSSYQNLSMRFTFSVKTFVFSHFTFVSGDFGFDNNLSTTNECLRSVFDVLFSC
jgi:hypothetical protein